MDHAYPGLAFDDDSIESFLRQTGLRFHRMTDIAAETSALLAQDKIVGWFQGRMEFGPRALGARLILASPIARDMQARLNRLLHELLTAFGERTGVRVLVNTSFNTRGEPIVCTPRDAIESFCSTPLDALVIGSFLLCKETADA